MPADGDPRLDARNLPTPVNNRAFLLVLVACHTVPAPQANKSEATSNGKHAAKLSGAYAAETGICIHEMLRQPFDVAATRSALGDNRQLRPRQLAGSLACLGHEPPIRIPTELDPGASPCGSKGYDCWVWQGVA